VDNLMDKAPPLYYDSIGYESGYVSRPMGRFFYMSVRKSF
jgi:outer membrane receptor protein involved in Fe transport